MKFGVGKKGSLGLKLAMLFAVLLIFSVLDTFSMTVHDDEDNEILNEVSEPQDNILPPELRGVRSAEPTWSPLFGSLPPANDYYGIDFGDVNNDGKLDVIVTAGQMVNNGIHCWVGDGTGGWTEESNGLPNVDWFTDVEVDDLNNDGKLDIACANWSGGRIWTGNGGEGGSMLWTLQNGPPSNWNSVALGDIDNNGTVDIAAGTDGGVKVWTSNGGEGGSFVWTDSSGSLPSGSYYGVFLGDVNNDGKLDLAAGSASNGGVKVWTGNGESGSSAVWTETSTGLPITGGYAQVCFGDANNDGKLDLAAASLSDGVKFWKGDGGLSWVEESSGLSTTERFYGLSFGDVNNDGKLDLVGANYTGARIDVWLGDGGKGGAMDWSSAREGLPTGSMIIDICLGDVNNDGRMDIGATTDSQGVQVWAGNLPDLVITGWESASTGLPTPPDGNGWYDVDFGDVNHDGKLDLAAASSSNQGVKVWLGDGNGVWNEVSDPDLPSDENYNGVRLIDVNHDGDLDLIAGNNSGSNGRVWLGDGTGGFGPDTGPISNTPLAGVEVADINNDGNVDMASCFYEPGLPGNKVYVWPGDGTGGWYPDTGPSETLGYDDVALGDVDHDGKVDLFATGHMDGFRFWLGDGSGGWTLQPPESGLPDSGGGGLGTCFGDVNHDGNLDVAIGAWVTGSFGIRVYASDGGKDGDVNWTEEWGGLPASGNYGGVELGDIDNDGNLDILSASCWGTNNGIGLYLGNGGAGGPMVWTNALLPNLPSSGNYWGVALGDVNNDGVLDMAITSGNGVEVFITRTQSQPINQIDLEEGWNLISLPLIQSDTSVDKVLESIDGEYDAVYYYNSTDNTDHWKLYHISKPPELLDLDELTHKIGFWAHITTPGGTVLECNGPATSVNQTITLYPGWNLVGYPSTLDRLRNDALNNIDFNADIGTIWTYDAAMQRWDEMEESDFFEVGRGYWIYSTASIQLDWDVPL